MKIGIVGQGYVGTAVKTVFEKHYECNTFDIKQECNCDTLQELVTKSEVIFVCVPTPMNKDRSCNTDIVEDVISDINDSVQIDRLNHNPKTDKIVVIKSTVPPGTTDRLNKENDNITVIFNPEFLTERTAFEDFHNQDHIILGKSSDSELFNSLVLFYKDLYPNARASICSSDESEAVKIFRNCFYAQKVMIFNEFYFLCNKLGMDYNRVRDLMLCDWLGEMHTMVPGPDGGIGYSGHCFPKDTEALLLQMKKNNSLIEDIKKNPSRYVNFSIIGGGKPYVEPK